MIDQRKVFEVGDRITIIPIDIIDPKKDMPSYTSKIEALSNDNFLILFPTQKHGYLYFKNNAEIEVNSIKNNKVYFFKAQVIKSFKQNKLLLLEIKRKSEINEIQRRMFFRFKTIVDVLLYLNNESFKGMSKDISGSGMCLIVNNVIEKGSVINLTFSLYEETIILDAEVVRVKKVTENDKYELGLKFIEIDSDSREKIIQYIFEEQRKLRKKGMM